MSRATKETLAMTSRMYDYLEQNPNSTIPELAKVFALTRKQTEGALLRLRRSGMVRVAKLQKDGLNSFIVDNGETSDGTVTRDVKQRCVTTWPPCRFPKQHIWSAVMD